MRVAAKILLCISMLNSYCGLVFADAVSATIETNNLINSGALVPKNSAIKSTVPSSDSDKFNLAKELANPVANLVSMPFQWEYNRGLGKNQTGTNQTLLFQPLIPIDLSGGDIFILRPIVAGTRQINVNGYTGYGMSNITIESFYSPYTGSSWLWGVGPYAVSPAGNSGQFGSQQTGAGVTAHLINRQDGWTYGVLGYQSWSVGGNPAFGTQNNLYAQPFIAYTTASSWTFSTNMEAQYNYDARRTSNPWYAGISKLEVFDGVPVEFSAGPMYYVNSIPGSPQGWGARAILTFVLIK
jgi:hypothetical protein